MGFSKKMGFCDDLVQLWMQRLELWFHFPRMLPSMHLYGRVLDSSTLLWRYRLIYSSFLQISSVFLLIYLVGRT
jgi:hypothetical protein